jgi:hypothetical protein
VQSDPNVIRAYLGEELSDAGTETR